MPCTTRTTRSTRSKRLEKASKKRKTPSDCLWICPICDTDNERALYNACKTCGETRPGFITSTEHDKFTILSKRIKKVVDNYEDTPEVVPEKKVEKKVEKKIQPVSEKKVQTETNTQGDITALFKANPALASALMAMQNNINNTLNQMKGVMSHMANPRPEPSPSPAPAVALGELVSFEIMPKGSSAYRVWKSVHSQWVRYIRPALLEKGVDCPKKFIEMDEKFLRDNFTDICEAPRLLKRLKATQNLPARVVGQVLYSSGLRRLLQNLLITWTRARTGRPRLVKDPHLLDIRTLAINSLMVKEPIRLPIRTFNDDEAKKIWDHMTQEPITVINMQRLMLYMCHVFLGQRTGRSIYKLMANFFGFDQDRQKIFFRGPTTKVKRLPGQKHKEIIHRNPIFVQTQTFNKLFLVYMELRGRCNPVNQHFFLKIKANANASVLVALKENLDVFEDAPLPKSKQTNWLRTLCEEAKVSTVDVVGRTLRNLHAIAQTRSGYAHTWKSSAIYSYLREHSDLGKNYVQVCGGSRAAEANILCDKSK